MSTMTRMVGNASSKYVRLTPQAAALRMGHCQDDGRVSRETARAAILIHLRLALHVVAGSLSLSSHSNPQESLLSSWKLAVVRCRQEAHPASIRHPTCQDPNLHLTVPGRLVTGCLSDHPMQDSIPWAEMACLQSPDLSHCFFLSQKAEVSRTCRFPGYFSRGLTCWRESAPLLPKTTG